MIPEECPYEAKDGMTCEKCLEECDYTDFTKKTYEEAVGIPKIMLLVPIPTHKCSGFECDFCDAWDNAPEGEKPLSPEEIEEEEVDRILHDADFCDRRLDRKDEESH